MATEPRTLCDIFYRSVETFRKPDALRYKKDGAWRDVSSEEFRRAVEELSMGLRALGVERGDRVGLLSENRPEWAYADLAVLCAAAVDVPIYTSLPASSVLYILNDSQSKAVFVSNEAQAAKVAEIRGQAPWLKHVIRMDDVPGEGTLTIAELRERGQRALAADRGAVKSRAAEAQPQDLATIIYTSGTTGEPKGVMLMHDNIVSNVAASAPIVAGFGPSDTALSFLPLCHIFERMGGFYLMLALGVTIAYAESIEKVPANMAEVRPTIMFSIPRLYEKMHARVKEKVASDPPARQKVFAWAIGVGRQAVRPSRGRHHAGAAAEAAGRAGGEAGVREDPGARGRPPAPLRLRRRAAGEGHQRISSAPPASSSSRATASPRRARSSP